MFEMGLKIGEVLLFDFDVPFYRTVEDVFEWTMAFWGLYIQFQVFKLIRRWLKLYVMKYHVVHF
jgi:hypothetical protein